MCIFCFESMTPLLSNNSFHYLLLFELVLNHHLIEMNMILLYLITFLFQKEEEIKSL
jgi:hypothetical protein